MLNNPYQKYMQQSVSTMTPLQLVIALYDKAEQELQKAIYYIENKDYANANNSIIKVQNIVSTLDASLKMKYEISENLASLYAYFKERLIQANIKKDTEILKELMPFFKELKESFEEISKKGL
ncbi:MAG TPA: flagellar export chaperone FliS [Oscillospiraceae bacterium]|nr:flagellar secretion chaperone FliS [Clostridiales bacterium]HOV41506.1 flagellar export chaperone FliS [Oscillospiraceae bacterium]